MVIIEDTVPVPRITRTPSAKHMTDAQAKIVERYKDAYKAIYGVPPTVTFIDPWFKINGHSSRVNCTRLKEMAKQLEYRAG